MPDKKRSSNTTETVAFAIRYLDTKLGETPDSHTLYNVILHIARNFLETRENIKIWTHSFYHVNLD